MSGHPQRAAATAPWGRRAVAAVAVVWMLAGWGSGALLAQETNAGDSATETTGTTLDPEFGVGAWIWTEESHEKQTARFWRGFEVPPGRAVTHATLRITVDNSYRVFLDGRELGRGSDWRWMTEYDVTWLLEPGRHALAVEAFNDREDGGVLVGLRVELSNGRVLEIPSDDRWHVVPEGEVGWERRLDASRHWPHATVVGAFGAAPHDSMPLSVTALPALQPITRRFWQTGWFQISLGSLCAVMLLACLWLVARLTIQSKAQQLLQRERVRIARDLHDDVGAGLTQLILLGEVAQTEVTDGSAAHAQFGQLSEKARAVSQLLDEVVWAVNARRDTVRDFTGYVCKYAQAYFKSSAVRCRLDVEPDMPSLGMDLVVRRNLFLAVKEAFNNVAKHSEATRVYLRIHRRGAFLVVVVEDNGKGFAPGAVTGERDGLKNMRERLKEMGGRCVIRSRPGQGCVVECTVSLPGGAFSARRRAVREAPPAFEETGEPAAALRSDSPQTQP